MAPSKPDRTQYHALAVNDNPSTSPRRAPSSPAAALDRANSVIGDYEVVFDATTHGNDLEDSGSTGSELELGSPRLEAFGITDAAEQEKSSVMGAALNFTNSIIGAGIIGLPYAFRQAGFFLGVALLIGLTVLVDWTVVLLVKAGKVSGKSSYQSLVDSVVGKRGSFLVAMFQFVFAFGAMCAYTVIVGDTLPTVLKALVPSIADAPLLSREWIMVLTTVFISFPLSMQRDMAALAKTSAVSMAAIVLIVSLIILRCLHLPESLLGDPNARFTWIGDSPIKAIGVISFAFVCHHNTFIIYGSLDLPTLDRGHLPHRVVTEETKAAELAAKFGVPVRADQTVLSHTPMQDLAKQFREKWVLAVGAEGMNGKRVLERYGFTKIVTPAEIHAWNPTIYPFGPTKQTGTAPTDIPDMANIDFAAILVLHDSRDWGTDLQIMIDVLRSPHGCLGDINTQHVPIYFSNPDFLWANAFPMPRFGQGALKTSLKAIWKELVGQDLVYQSYGKPEYLTYAYAFRRLHQEILRHPELPASLTNNDNEHFEVYAVGDNPHADILGANRHGWHSLLVRTGVYQAGIPAITPTAVVDQVESAVQFVWDRHFGV
ncbi:TIGR01456 family HAD hydrolase [Allomyces macrogynus ATCC 38327]|uniref:TIGR01456 family HAD hydrolase n=1 Tax=Allomyces macrogynus (strain ATCC 38327) TaxID=578462 RepID=A0A0L0SUF3_ALLM3|nr:TIGR01456 family HAD hydrolase [Allomyces macrogynus ATCC 38327]|eukprot:KNE66228.1 TIGR01456 family HAD hydrolase [Allomyces macrogynus ATCC 38327]